MPPLLSPPPQDTGTKKNCQVIFDYAIIMFYNVKVIKEIKNTLKIVIPAIIALALYSLKDTQMPLNATNIAIFCGLPLLTLLIAGGAIIATNLKK